MFGSMKGLTFDKERAVRKFQEYLKIRTCHPDPDYESCIIFLDKYAAELGLSVTHVPVGEGQTVILIMKWPGRNPSLPSVVLNSHTDVAVAYDEHWKYDPWSAFKDDKGNIYGRGTQDMKSVGIQYLEAIRMLKEANMQFERTIYLTFMPDEQIGGFSGVKLFIQTPEFKDLNIGFILDEGLAHPENKYCIYYGERVPWWVRVKCQGNPGHASRFIENTAAEKLRKVINQFLEFRQQEEDRMKGKCLLLGDVSSVNLTMLEGGIQQNVVPSELIATFDIRIPPSVDLKAFEEKIKTWCDGAGSDVSYDFLQKSTVQVKSPITKDDPWWKAFSDTLEKKGTEMSLEIFSAFTDSRYFRELGYPAIGFSPMKNTPILMHDHNEFLNEKVFLEGIEVYSDLLPALANLAA